MGIQINQLWKRIIEASVHDLQKLCISESENLSLDQEAYIKILQAYHDCRFDQLELLVRGNWNTLLLTDIAELRLGIRKKDLSSEQLNSIENRVLLKRHEDILLGEFYFVLAYAAEGIGNQTLALTHYEKAVKLFMQTGLEKKTLKASFNALACKSRLYPDARYLSDCHYIIREAEKIGEASVEAMARHNLSRELQKMGAVECALDEIRRAKAILKDHYRSFNYAQVLVHEADLLCELGWFTDAKVVMCELGSTDFAEIREALKVLENEYFAGENEIQKQTLTRNWQKRYPKSDARRITPLENKCLEELSKGPRDKFALIQKLYGNRVDFYSLENRFKVLLTRLRKKFPREIVFFRGQYSLKDEKLR